MRFKPPRGRRLLGRLFSWKAEPLVGMLLALSLILISWIIPAEWGLVLLIIWVALPAVILLLDWVSGVIGLGLILAHHLVTGLGMLTHGQAAMALFALLVLYSAALWAINMWRGPRHRLRGLREAIEAALAIIMALAIPVVIALSIALAYKLLDVIAMPLAIIAVILLLVKLTPIGVLVVAILLLLGYVAPGVTAEQLINILIGLAAFYAGGIISLIPLKRGRRVGRPATTARAPAPVPQVGPAQRHPKPPPTRVAVRPAAPPAERMRRGVGLAASWVGAYTPSGLQMARVAAPSPHAHLPDLIKIPLEVDPTRRWLKLSLPGKEVVFRSGDVGAGPVIDAILSSLPEADAHLAYEYHVDEGSVWRALGEAFARGSSVIIVQRRKRGRPALPLAVKGARTADYIHHKFASTIPEDLHLLLYGKALHSALNVLVKTRDVERALDAYLSALRRDKWFPVLYGEEAIRSGERAAPPLEELLLAGRRAMQLFMETEIYREYGLKYAVPDVRLIIIGDSAAVFARPDFKSADDKAIYDIKTVDLRSSPREVFERVRAQMRVFQLAYPGARAAVLCIPYNCDRITTVEFEPLTYDDVRDLLSELERFCMEHGKEMRLRAERGEVIVRYLPSGNEIKFEVMEPAEAPSPPHTS